VAAITVNGASIQDNKWHPFRFPPLLESKGRTYYFSLESANAAPGNALTAYLSLGPSDVGTRYENGRPRDGSLAFRTYYLAPTPDEQMLAELIALRRELQERDVHRRRGWWARLMNSIRGW